MSAPYTVSITVANAEGQEMLLVRQTLEEYWALVAYEKALVAGIFDMADTVVAEKNKVKA